MKGFESVAKKMLYSSLGPQFYQKLVALKMTREYWSSLVYWESIRRLKVFRNKHKGERCFIIGNGPSLARMDLTPLKKEITFGLNRIYLLLNRLGFSTTYYISVNQLVIEQCLSEMPKIQGTKFLSWRVRKSFPFTKDVIFIRNDEHPKFSTDIVKEGVWEGATVTYVALQLAFYMGFQKVILIGVDHSYEAKGQPNEIVTMSEKDPNHFQEDYFWKGFQWQLPDLKTSEFAYSLARDQFENSGREVLDATLEGKLNVFPKADFKDII